jgi:hypothetical protein
MELKPEYFLGGLALFGFIVNEVTRKLFPNSSRDKMRTVIVREIVTRTETKYLPTLNRCPHCGKELQ